MSGNNLQPTESFQSFQHLSAFVRNHPLVLPSDPLSLDQSFGDQFVEVNLGRVPRGLEIFGDCFGRHWPVLLTEILQNSEVYFLQMEISRWHIITRQSSIQS